MRVTLSIRKTLEENAETYFEAAKKAKRKLQGARLAAAKAAGYTKVVASKPVLANRKEWFERFRWTKSSSGTLIIAGKDADSNEYIMKHHTDASDTVVHTDMPGSPFGVIKGPADAAALEAAATLVACFSKAWKQGLAIADVFAVKPEQLSKTPRSGEFIGKGSFIVRGEKNYLQPKLQISLGVIEGKPLAGLPSLFEAAHVQYVTLKPGSEKTADIAKKLVKRFGLATDSWSGLIPSGGSVITTHKNVMSERKT